LHVLTRPSDQTWSNQ